MDSALECHRQALAIRERLAPDSLDVADTLSRIGGLYMEEGDWERGSESLTRAALTLERARAQVAAPMDRTGLTSQAGGVFDQLVCLLAARKPQEAFEWQERGRARALVEQSAERWVDFGAGAPQELVGEQQQLDAQRDSLQSHLLRAVQEGDEDQVTQLRAELALLQGKQDDLAARIRRSSPRYAALQYPDPPSLLEMQKALDAGTLLLSYTAAPESTGLFALDSAGGLTVHRCVLSAGELEGQVRRLRAAVSGRQPWLGLAQALYRDLIAPVADRVAKAQRLLIIPDKSLHYLPFCLLADGRGKLLGDRKPIHYAQSVSVYAAVRKDADRPREQPPLLAMAFGDPVYAESSSPEGAARAGAYTRAYFASRGLEFSRLPRSGQEAQAICDLFAPLSTAFLREQATEEKAKQEAGKARLLHFACHGYIDPERPMNSALVLTLPGEAEQAQENGFLQTYEVYGLKLNADLVTLSACETGLGKELGGEGIVGLTRAFMYAGAPSVMVSLWKVADESTAELMKAFYGHLKRGASKDAALQSAMSDLRRRPEYAHPYYWAPFILYGDWRPVETAQPRGSAAPKGQ